MKWRFSAASRTSPPGAPNWRLPLTLGATGGVYIGGGIIPQLGNFFATSPFRTRFEAKGRYTTFLAAIPVYVITAQYPALVGCAQAFTHPSPRLESA